MLNVVSPRIHNLGDFAHCLPVLSGLYKFVGEKFNFVICDRLQRFRGIKEMLSEQEMFNSVTFVDEHRGGLSNVIIVDDHGADSGYGNRPIMTQKVWNYMQSQLRVNFPIDDLFVLKVKDVEVEDTTDKIVIGDRWSPKDAPDVDTRRWSNLIEAAEIIPKEKAHYLDYTKDLTYNLNLIRKNPNPFVTTFTGVGILADLMMKDTYVLWDEDMRVWQGWTVEHDFDLHYYKDRFSKLMYIRDYKI